MPRSPGDRKALEAALSPAQREVLAEACRTLGLDREGWHEAPSVAPFWEFLAFEQTVGRLREAGETAEGARIVAGLRLGLSEEAVERALRRQRSRADKLSGVGDAA